LHRVAFSLDPAQFLAGWREQAGTVFVPTLSESRVGDEVAIRIGLHGHDIRATLFGKIALVRRVGRPALPPGAEIHLESHSRAAARFLAMAARGEPVSFRERAPRWSVRRRLRVEHRGTALELTTVNVSESGCALEWSGELPPVGDEIVVRLAEGLFGSSVRGVVCWSEPGGAAKRTVGVRLVSAGRGGRHWRALVAAAASAGAPSA
jgi:Tfp pilus assembly protein PilZ